MKGSGSMNNEAYFNYGINSVELHKENEELLDINYGKNKIPISIYKNDIIDLIKAIIPAEEIEYRGITAEKVEKALQEDGVSVLNYLLGGRAMILITDFKNYMEYTNGGQNHIKKITGLNIDGKMELENAFNYETKQPSFRDLYPPTPKGNENKQEEKTKNEEER